MFPKFIWMWKWLITSQYFKIRKNYDFHFKVHRSVCNFNSGKLEVNLRLYWQYVDSIYRTFAQCNGTLFCLLKMNGCKSSEFQIVLVFLTGVDKFPSSSCLT